MIELSQVGSSFKINRTTGQFQGKMSSQPEILIEQGKAKRTVLQQAELQFNSLINKTLNKGYKRLDSLTNKKFEDITLEELDTLVPTIKTDQEGNRKPMLAKSSNDCSLSALDKPLYCSKKLNGVRMMVKWDDELNKPITISRGGKNYDVGATLITKQLHEYLSENKDVILDGELYIHGRYLQEISGMARLETWEDRCEDLEFWIYDIADDTKTFNKRYDLLEDLRVEVNHDKEKYSKIEVIDHILTEGWLDIKKLHDQWVSEGYEGLVARKPNRVYAFGKRGSDMIKVKEYQEDEFEIIGYKDGLRPEDFVFVCKTKDDKEFEAKPIGDRALKDYYLNNMEDIIGKMGTVKFFEYSSDNVPLQTVFQAVRYDL